MVFSSAGPDPELARMSPNVERGLSSPPSALAAASVVEFFSVVAAPEFLRGVANGLAEALPPEDQLPNADEDLMDDANGDGEWAVALEEEATG